VSGSVIPREERMAGLRVGFNRSCCTFRAEEWSCGGEAKVTVELQGGAIVVPEAAGYYAQP